MAQNPEIETLEGLWTYRSLLNDPDIGTGFDKLEFGRAHIEIAKAPFGVLRGRIFDTGWELTLSGAIGYGDPWSVRFQGKGVVGGETWIYNYAGYVIPPWPDGVDQRPAITGSIIRTVPHSGSAPGTVNPAGVVCTFYAVRDS